MVKYPKFKTRKKEASVSAKGNVNSPSKLMDQLLSSYVGKQLKLDRGQKVSGKILTLSDNEIIVDLGSKAEGVINRKELPSSDSDKLKVGETVSVYVVNPEGPSGQVLLSVTPSATGSLRGGQTFARLLPFVQNKQTLKGRVLEVNRGGLVVEVEGVRGFLPSSQVSLGKSENLEEMVGKEVEVVITEVDPENLRLILTQKAVLSDENKKKLHNYNLQQRVSGRIKTVLTSGLIVDLGGVEGYVHISEVSWDRVENLGAIYSMNQQVEAVIIGIDEVLGRVELSIRALSEDPIIEYTKDHQVDDVVTGVVTRITDSGVIFKLAEGVEGMMHTSKYEPGVKYEPGLKAQLLIDNMDPQRRRISLAPFITSTEGLIYK